jgi:membrane associated rhomboid family serine protease
MLEDRDYMRQPAYHEPRVSFTVALLIVNAVVFLVECATLGYPPIFLPGNYFALSVEGLKHGFVWQLLTYQFMHAGLLHIFLNGWAIYVFGREIEAVLGSKKFLILFLSAGVIGGIVQELTALVWPDLFGLPVVGASAGAFGLVAAYAMLFPERELTLLLFFVLPIRLSAKMLLIGSAALAVFGLAFHGNNIANAAHLGGMLTGIVFIRQFIQGRWPRWTFPARRSTPRKLVASRSGNGSFWRSAAGKPDEDLPAAEFLSSEVDPILDKISAHGIHSLTAREREILERARKKMTGR